MTPRVRLTLSACAARSNVLRMIDEAKLMAPQSLRLAKIVGEFHRILGFRSLLRQRKAYWRLAERISRAFPDVLRENRYHAVPLSGSR